MDSLAWDLGNPDDSILNNPLDFTLGPFPAPPTVYEDFHPMKGPMTTQTLRGMDGHGSMHWRGDRTFGNDEANVQPDNGSYNEFEAFKKFAGAFESLLGRATAATTAEIEAFASFILEVLPPPNPIRNLDDSTTFMQQAGETFYFTNIVDTLTCNTCHVLNRSQGFFGTDGRASFEGEPQHMKIPHLRNMYAKVGMFGMPDVAFFNTGNNAHQGDQIRGFGFLHDGSTDTLLRFLNASLFNFPGGDLQRQQVEQFLFSFDSNLKPVVGQQITLTDSNEIIAGPRITLLINQALAGDADLVVKGVVNGEARGWHRNASSGLFESDKAGEGALSDAALRALAQVPGQMLTYTAVPPGSGVRIGIDGDEDAVLDSDDNCPTTFNLLQEDIDIDGVGDACDNCVNVANNPDAGGNFQLDTDGDGYGNMCDADIASLPQGDGFVDFSDLTQFNSAFFTADADADFDGTGFVDFSDLTIFEGLFFQPPGPSCVAP